MRHPGLLLVIVSALAPHVAAQATLPISAGQRVRLTLDDRRLPVVGLLVSQDGDSLRVLPHPGAEAVTVATSSVSAAYVSLGRHSNAGTGALIGLVTGGLLGVAAGSCGDRWGCPGPAAGGLSLGLAAAGLGAIIGAVTNGERWDQVSPPRMQVSVTAPGRGLGVGVSIRM